MKVLRALVPKIFLRSELIRNTSVLVSGTIAAQLIPILLQPFLRRFFSPEAFGTFSVYMSLIGIITIITCLRYDDAVVLPGKDKEAANVLFLGLFFNFCINLILLLIIILSRNKIIQLLNLPEGITIGILYLIPLGVFLYNTFQLFNNWLIRRKKFYHVSLSKLVRRGGEAAGQFTFAITKMFNGLIISDIIGQSLNVATVIISGFKSGFRFSLFSIVKIKYVLEKYSDFPKFNLIPALLSALSFYLPTILINRFYSAELTGYFDLTKVLLSIPLALIATSFSNVLLQRISEKFNRKESLISDVKPVLYIVGSIIVIELLLISFFGTELFVFVFGEKWRISGDISKILVWSFSFNFLVSTFSCIYISMRKIKIYSIWQFIYFMLIISLILFRQKPFVEFIKIYVLIEIVAYTILSLNMLNIFFRYEVSVKEK